MDRATRTKWSDTEYQLQCSGGGQVYNWTVMGLQTTASLSRLIPYTNYSCNITAHTRVGGGPAATTSVTTQQDGESVKAEKYGRSPLSVMAVVYQCLVEHLVSTRTTNVILSDQSI